jgi:CheY-like chemotaxis protein
MKKRILVVDDFDMNRDLISRMLELEGYEVTLASNGMKAIQSVLKDMPNLAIVDILMPNMDGYEVCQKLRQPPISASIPILLITAMRSDMETERALQVGANEVWAKPFEMERFLRRIKELLGEGMPEGKKKNK